MRAKFPAFFNLDIARIAFLLALPHFKLYHDDLALPPFDVISDEEGRMVLRFDKKPEAYEISSDLSQDELSAVLPLFMPAYVVPPSALELKKQAELARVQRLAQVFLEALKNQDAEKKRACLELLLSAAEYYNQALVNLENGKKVTWLYAAAYYGCKESVMRLLAWQAPVDSGGAEAESPLMAAVEQGRAGVIPLLIKAGANLKYQSSAKLNILMVCPSLEIFRLIRQFCYAKKYKYFFELLNLNPDFYALLLKKSDLQFAYDVARQNLDWASYKTFLSRARRQYWETPRPELHAFCQWMHQHYSRIHLEGPPVLSSSNRNSRSYEYELFAKVHLSNLQVMMTEAAAVLDNIRLCNKYLKKLNSLFREFYFAEFGTNFPRMQDSVGVVTLDYLFFPLPEEGYQGIKKHSALPRFLLAFFADQGLKQTAYKWIGFIPEEIANPMLERGDFVMEDRRGLGLFHGKLSHMLQLAILCLAIADGKISLADYSLQDFIAAFIKEHTANGQNCWLSLRDSRHFFQITYQDPLHVHTQVMQATKDLPELSAYLTDSFCKGLLRLYALFKQTRPEFAAFSFAEFVKLQGDLQFHSFANFSWVDPNLGLGPQEEYRVVEKKYPDSSFFSKKPSGERSRGWNCFSCSRS